MLELMSATTWAPSALLTLLPVLKELDPGEDLLRKYIEKSAKYDICASPPLSIAHFMNWHDALDLITLADHIYSGSHRPWSSRNTHLLFISCCCYPPRLVFSTELFWFYFTPFQ
jgi:hypothetical protein